MDIFDAHEKGFPIVANCCFGFMTQFDNGDIRVPTENIIIQGPAEAEFVRQVLKVWGAALAEYEGNPLEDDSTGE